MNPIVLTAFLLIWLSSSAVSPRIAALILGSS